MKTFTFSPKAGAVLAIVPTALDVTYTISVKREVCVEAGVGIVDVSGPLEHHDGGDADSYDAIIKRLESTLANEEVKAVVIRFCSPGGLAAGANEAHKKIRRLRKSSGKPIYAYADETMCSAAYQLGSACDEIWLPETGEVGSVGVIATIRDLTEAHRMAGVKVDYVTSGAFKADLQPGNPVTKGMRARVQSHVDTFARAFFQSVSRARGFSPAAYQSLQAGVFLGKKAVKAGLADQVATWDEFMATVRAAHGIDAPENDPSPAAQERTPSPSLETRRMSALLKITASIQSATTALATAKTPAERATLLATLTALNTQLASKTTRTMEHREREVSDDDDGDEDDDSDEEEESEEEEESKSEEGKEGEEEEEEEKKAVSRSALTEHNGRKAMALLNAAKKATGAKSLSGVLGALSGLPQRIGQSDATAARLAQLEKDKVMSMLEAATADGRITPAQVKSLAAKGLDDVEWLKGHLAVLPKRVRNKTEAIVGGHTAAPTLAQQRAAMGGDTSSMNDQQKMLLAASMGLTPEEKAVWDEHEGKAAAKWNGNFGLGTKERI